MRAARLAWGLWAVALVLVLLGPVLQAIVDQGDAVDALAAAGFVAVELGTATAGAIVAARFPRNAVGWIFLGIGTGVGLTMTCGAYADLGLNTSHGPLPGDAAAAWVSDWAFVPFFFGGPMFLLLLFPDGRFLSRRWRVAGVWLGGLIVLATAGVALKPGRLEEFPVDNPVAPGGTLGDVTGSLDAITGVLALPAFALAAAALIVRLRRSRGVERQQLKWFTYAASLVAAGLAGSALAPTVWLADLFFLSGILALAGLPVAAGIAVLRYRLYDIDLVIRRTLVYAGLSATLLAAYLGCVLALGALLSPIAEESDLAIAGSTLAVAALFGPARARIQGVVDRRFYRSKYDAARTLEGFGARLRDEIELESLSNELRGVVSDTMRPAHVSLWLRGDQG